jgi:hypothetical protein
MYLQLFKEMLKLEPEWLMTKEFLLFLLQVQQKLEKLFNKK